MGKCSIIFSLSLFKVKLLIGFDWESPYPYLSFGFLPLFLGTFANNSSGCFGLGFLPLFLGCTVSKI